MGCNVLPIRKGHILILVNFSIFFLTLHFDNELGFDHLQIHFFLIEQIQFEDAIEVGIQ